MAFRWIAGVVVAWVTLTSAVPVTADGFGEFFSSIGRDTKRRNCWPQPFDGYDRQAAREPINLMVSNGWQRQNMLSDAHFEAGGSQLTEAGRLRALWIANEAPEQHRIVYVHRAATPQETNVRIQTVQQLIAQSAYPGLLPPVLESSRSDAGAPADRADLINRKFQAAVPDPKLPPPTSSSSGGSGK